MTVTASERLITLAVFTFNQENYVREAIKAALAQDYSPLQIIISDDASTDDTYQIIEDEVGRYVGPHVVRLNRNTRNLGVAEHLNLVIGMSESNFIVMAAGDDISCPERVRVLSEEYYKVGAEHFYISSDALIIDADGQGTGKPITRGLPPDNLCRLIRGTAMPLGATSACTKSLFGFFGGLHPKLANEDFVLPLRAHLLGKVAYINRPLVLYRVAAGSSSQDDPLAVRRNTCLRRANYLKKQQIAVASMLHDLLVFASCPPNDEKALPINAIRARLCKRLLHLDAMAAYWRYQAEGRKFKAMLQIASTPRAFIPSVIDRRRRVAGSWR